MGAGRRCTLKLGRRTAEGTAHLASTEVAFRGGDLRLRIPFSDMRRVAERDGELEITFSRGTAVLALGRDAARWADKIRNPKGLIDTLGVKPGQRVVVLKVPDAGFAEQLRERGAAVSTRAVKEADVIFIGAETLAGLTGLRQLATRIKRDGAVWTVTPKGKGGIRDADVMAVGRAAGLVDVKVVSFSATHSANNFVVPRAAR